MTDNQPNVDVDNEFLGEAVEVDLSKIAVPQTPPKGSSGGGRVQIKNPVDGTLVNRTDYIRALAKNGWTRSQIVTHLQETYGKDSITYQGVFQATKDMFPKRKGTTSGVQAPIEGDAGDAGEAIDDSAIGDE